ncbi:methylated-DNA--[protein]-cysteine S-methyltransferase [soil metagenome]
MTTRWMDSPIGGLRLHAGSGLLTAIEFGAEVTGVRSDDAVLDEAEAQLRAYFAGDLKDFDLPLSSEGTEFQKKVWGQLRKIPYGATASYGEIARRLGLATGVSRAVGAANGANSLPIVVPCHRVIGSNGTLTGYAGGVDRKRILLNLENPGLF